MAFAPIHEPLTSPTPGYAPHVRGLLGKTTGDDFASNRDRGINVGHALRTRHTVPLRCRIEADGPIVAGSLESRSLRPCCCPQRKRNLQLQGILLPHGLVNPLLARAFSLGGLPNSGLACNAPHPPRRYCASHPYIVRRLILKDRATPSGFSPACTLRTARMRIASSVA
jgi:hypothetical protein